MVNGMENANGKYKNSAVFDSKLIFYNFNSQAIVRFFTQSCSKWKWTQNEYWVNIHFIGCATLHKIVNELCFYFYLSKINLRWCICYTDTPLKRFCFMTTVLETQIKFLENLLKVSCIFQFFVCFGDWSRFNFLWYVNTTCADHKPRNKHTNTPFTRVAK